MKKLEYWNFLPPRRGGTAVSAVNPVPWYLHGTSRGTEYATPAYWKVVVCMVLAFPKGIELENKRT